MYLEKTFLFICLFSTIKCFFMFGHRNRFNYLLSEFNKNVSFYDLSSSIDTKWIEQPLDHFNETDNRIWKMRYLQRLDMWKTGGPIYLFIGGEERIGKGYLQTGTTYELAKETNGAMFLSEHRYYGDSKPFGDFTPENLRYLSSRQALGDLARLLESIKRRPEFTESKVVVVGGSYAANLAAWLKLLYPDLVDAAVASSGPVEAKTDFYEFFETVANDYKKYGSPGCYEKIEQFFKECETKFGTKDGIEQFKKMFGICPENDMTKSENKQLFFFRIANYFMNIAQGGFIKDIERSCSNYNTILRTFSANFNVENILTWNEKEKCFDCEFNNFIKNRKNDDIMESWVYQICTEFGYFMTTSSDNQPFTKNIPVDFYFKLCTATFGEEFDQKRVEEGVKKTNEMYGGLHPNVSKVVFVNGELDPWHKLSVLEDISPEVPAIVIPFSSHCKDLFSDREEDPKELKEARRYVKNLVKKWIGF